MACIVFKACNGGDAYAFKAPDDVKIPTDTADVQTLEWLHLSELVEERAELMCALEAGEEFTIGVNATDDPGWARLASDSLWCGGYYEMPADDDDDDENDDDEEEPIACPACDGPAEILGKLGSRTHARCRSCGIDCSIV